MSACGDILAQGHDPRQTIEALNAIADQLSPEERAILAFGEPRNVIERLGELHQSTHSTPSSAAGATISTPEASQPLPTPEPAVEGEDAPLL